MCALNNKTVVVVVAISDLPAAAAVFNQTTQKLQQYKPSAEQVHVSNGYTGIKQPLDFDQTDNKRNFTSPTQG